MKNLIVLTLFLTASALAQSGDPVTASSSGPVLDELVSNVENVIVPAAESMPEDKYSFTPKQGDFKGVRTFGEQVKHLAAANYLLASRALGERPPAGIEGENAPQTVKTKSEIIEYLKGSFANLHRAAATVNEQNAVSPIPGTKGTWQRTRLGLIIDALVHSQDHYGQMVEYLRMNNIIPPESR